MKLMLAMVTPLKWQGRLIPVGQSPFVIGRQPGCDLRANSPTVGLRHCALLIRNERVFVRDFPDIPCTLVNNRPVQGEMEVHDRDRVQAGGLMFTIRLRNNPETPPRSSAEAEEEAVANLLLALDAKEEHGSSPSRSVAGTLTASAETRGGEPSRSYPAKTKPMEPELPDTAAAARMLLAKLKKPHGLGIGERRVMAPQGEA